MFLVQGKSIMNASLSYNLCQSLIETALSLPYLPSSRTGHAKAKFGRNEPGKSSFQFPIVFPFIGSACSVQTIM